MAIRQITIIGTGLIGGSFGLALKKHRFRGRVVGCGRGAVVKRARKKGAIEKGATNPLQAVRGSQIILLATPVGAIIELIESLGPRLSPQTLLTDVGSTKVEVLSHATRVFGDSTRNRF